MGMGMAAASADVIEVKSIRKFCKDEYDAFIGLVEGCELDMEEFARNAEYDLDDYDKDVVKAYKELCSAFENKTGLGLNVAFHNSEDEGDIYDDVDGIYWYVDGMYELTPAGKIMEKYVERKNFVQFG